MISLDPTVETRLTDIVIKELFANGLSLYDSPQGCRAYVPGEGVRGAQGIYDPEQGFDRRLRDNNPPNPWLEEGMRFPSMEEATAYASTLTDVAFLVQGCYLDQALNEECQAEWHPDLLAAQGRVRERMDALAGSAHAQTVAKLALMSLEEITAWSNEHRALLPYSTTVTPAGQESAMAVADYARNGE